MKIELFFQFLFCITSLLLEVNSACTTINSMEGSVLITEVCTIADFSDGYFQSDQTQIPDSGTIMYTYKFTINNTYKQNLDRDEIVTINTELYDQFGNSYNNIYFSAQGTHKFLMVVTTDPYNSSDALKNDIESEQDLVNFLATSYIDINSYCSDKNAQYIGFNLQNFINKTGENNNNNDFIFYLQVFEQGGTGVAPYYFKSTFKIHSQNSDQTCSQYCGRNGEGSCYSGICDCQKGYFDIDCTTEAVQIYPSQQVSLNVKQEKWQFAYIDLTDISNSLTLQYNDDSFNQGIKVDDFYYGYEYYYRPSPCGYVKLDNVNDKVLDYETIKSYLIAVDQYAFFDKYNKVYMFGFYNSGSQSTATVKFEIIQNNSQEENSSDDHLYYYIIFLGVGFCLCLIIIILYCKRKSALQIVYLQNAQAYSQGLDQQRRTAQQLKKQKFLKKYKSLIQYLMPKNTYAGYLEKYPNLKETTECVVCLVEFEQEEESRFTLCGHLFHNSCFDQWVIKNLNCPFCREDYGPSELMKIYRQKKSGNTEELEKKQSKYMKHLKQDINQNIDEDFGILDQINNSKIADTVHNTQIEGGSQRNQANNEEDENDVNDRQFQQLNEIQSIQNLNNIQIHGQNQNQGQNNIQSIMNNNSNGTNVNAISSNANSNRYLFQQEENKSQELNLGNSRQERGQRQQRVIRQQQSINDQHNQSSQPNQQVDSQNQHRRNLSQNDSRRKNQLLKFNTNNISEEQQSQKNLLTHTSQNSVHKLNENEISNSNQQIINNFSPQRDYSSQYINSTQNRSQQNINNAEKNSNNNNYRQNSEDSGSD